MKIPLYPPFSKGAGGIFGQETIMRKGYIQVYTGNGKGKTTAALGLAVRAAGAGLRVFIAQFIKKQKCSEHALLDELGDRITVRQYGRGLIMGRKPSPADIKAAQEGYEEAKRYFSRRNTIW